MDGKEYMDCVHFKERSTGRGHGGCTHPKKGMWTQCSTMHIEDFDAHSCQPGWYQPGPKKMEKETTKLKGLYNPELKVVKPDEPFYLRLVEASTYGGSVEVEAVNTKGERIALICRISKEEGIELYEDVPKSLGFPMLNNAVKVQEDLTC
jgi:hypothetical protein